MKYTLLPDYIIESLNENFGYYIKKENILFSTQTEYQKLEILDTNIFGRMLRLDNIFQTSEKDEFLYHEVLVHPSGISLGGPKKALVIGGGDGGTIEEILKYNTIEKVYMIELDKQVVDISQKYLKSISNNAFLSPKLELIFGDGIEYINNIKQKIDMVILDLTDPTGESIQLYTMDFYKKIKEKLSTNGVLSLHIESPISRPNMFNRIYKTLGTVFKHVHIMLNYVPLYGTLWGFATASETINPTIISREQVQNRIKEYKLKKLQFYNSDTHFSLFSIPDYVNTILKQKVDIININDKLEDSTKDHLKNTSIIQIY